MRPTSKGTSSRSSSASADGALHASDLTLGRRICGVSFVVAPRQTLVVLGPSGAGKTSLLRLLAGLEPPDCGTLRFDGADLSNVPAERRRIAMVFQQDALLPHLSIEQNLRFAMRSVKPQRVREIAAALEIGHRLHERPARLSGGERQRASLARAVLSEPRVLLLDEPLAHLDPQLRRRVASAFAAFVHEWGGPVIFVTHDHEEALALGDRIAILIAGRIVQCDVPQNVYDRPATLEAARFFGTPAMNLLDEGMHIIGIRAEHVRIDRAAPLRGTVLETQPAGADTFVRAATAQGEIVARVRRPADLPGRGDETGFAFDRRAALRFDKTTGLLLQ
ncbi:MAG: ABC transporter ATP-binding protein [Candidatus Baltobacteraceae bacterium]